MREGKEKKPPPFGQLRGGGFRIYASAAVMMAIL